MKRTVKYSISLITIILWGVIYILGIEAYNERKNNYREWKHNIAKQKLLKSISNLRRILKEMKTKEESGCCSV